MGLVFSRLPTIIFTPVVISNFRDRYLQSFVSPLGLLRSSLFGQDTQLNTLPTTNHVADTEDVAALSNQSGPQSNRELEATAHDTGVAETEAAKETVSLVQKKKGISRSRESSPSRKKRRAKVLRDKALKDTSTCPMSRELDIVLDVIAYHFCDVRPCPGSYIKLRGDTLDIHICDKQHVQSLDQRCYAERYMFEQIAPRHSVVGDKKKIRAPAYWVEAQSP